MSRRRLRLLPAMLATALTATLLPVVTSTSVAHAASPTYAFADVGSIATVGYPVGISDDGTVATSKGVWSNGTFTPMPATFLAIRAISADGLALGTSTAACPAGTSACTVTWNPTTAAVTAYAYPADARDPMGNPCGGSNMHGLDANDEAFGYTTYWNPASTFDHCVGGQTIQVGAYIGAPGGLPTHIDALYDALSMTPHFALGFGADATTTTLLNRTTSAVTPHADFALSQTFHQQLADDGAFAALHTPDLLPGYESPAGVESTLQHPNGLTTVTGINDSHQIIGFDNTGAILWPTPTSAPVTLDTLATLPADQSTSDAYYISNSGDITGTFDSGTSTNDSVYALTISTSLSASIALKNADGTAFTGAGAKVGDTVKATVTLTNSSLSQAVTGLTADPALTVVPGGALTFVSGPTPAVPTSIPAASSVQYVMTYTIHALGNATLSVNATGTQNALPASANASVVAHLGQVLQVTITFQHTDGSPIANNTLKMVDTDDGEVAQDLTAVVTIKNVGGVQQDNVAFNGPLIASFHNHAQALPKVPITVTSGPTDSNPSTPLATLPVGATAKRTYGLHLTNNGVFDLSSQLTSGDDGGSGTNVSGGVGTLTANPTALLFLKLHPVSDITKLITPGQPVLLAGSLVNRSQTQAIDLTPIIPDVEAGGNAGGGFIRDSSVSPLPDGVEIPLAGKIPPATTVQVEAEIDTAPVASTRATVAYKPHGYVINDDATETALTDAQVRVATGSSPIEIHLDARDPVDTATPTELAGEFTKAAFIGVSEWYFNGFKAGQEILEHPVDSAYKLASGTVGFVTGVATTAKQAAQMLGAMYVLQVYSEALTPDERLNFSNQIVADYEASNIHTAHVALQAAADPILTDFSNAVSSGNYTKVARMSGSGLATGTTAIADTVLAEIAFQKIALLAKSRIGTVAEGEMASKITFEDAIKQHKVQGKVGNALKGIVEGQNLLLNRAKALIDAYGLSADQIARLTKYCEENGITVALRSRSKRALKLIQDGLAVGKNIAIKLKNVDSLDVAFLGYDAADINTVVWAEPISNGQFRANLAKYGRKHQLTAEIRELAEARYHQRIKEWAKQDYHNKVNHWAKDRKIEVYFDGAGSGVPELDKARKDVRAFKLEQAHDQKRYYKRLLVGETNSLTARFVRITQDVDLVAILGGNGQILSPKLRAKVYEFLENTLGIEHPDTAPWVLNGEVVFEAKLGLLVDHLAGGEAIAAFGPDGGARAAFFDPKLTVFDRVTKGGYIFLKGAFNNPYAPEAIGPLGKLL